MVKNTSINTTLTVGATANEFAETVLGRVVEVQERWSPGALVVGILAAAITQQIVIITPSLVASYNRLLGANPAIGLSNSVGTASGFIAVPSESRSKNLTRAYATVPDDVVIEITNTQDGNPLAIDQAILLPEIPKYTLLSLINKLEGLLFASGLGYLILVDQETEGVYYETFATQVLADAAALDHIGNTLNPVFAATATVAFNTVPPSAGSSETPAYGWE